MNNELLEEIKNKYREKYKRENIDAFRIYQLDLIGKLRTKYHKLKQSEEEEEKKLALSYIDDKIINFFYILSRNKRKLTRKELDYLEKFFCEAPAV